MPSACAEKNIFEREIMSSFLQCLIWACNWKHEPEAWGVVWARDTDLGIISDYPWRIYTEPRGCNVESKKEDEDQIDVES